jgi:hypothetical protein
VTAYVLALSDAEVARYRVIAHPAAANEADLWAGREQSVRS